MRNYWFCELLIKPFQGILLHYHFYARIINDFGIFHWLAVLAIALILFGGRRMPEVMQRLGEELARQNQMLASRPRPLRLSRGETRWQALIPSLRQLLSKLIFRGGARRE